VGGIINGAACEVPVNLNGVAVSGTNGGAKGKDPRGGSTATTPADPATAAEAHDKNQHATTATATTTRHETPFNAVQQGGAVIDIYAYHRGREGRELRDEATGDLLYGDVEASDTNHHSGDKEPKTMTTAVIIKFPLEESEAEPERELQSESPSQSQRCGPSVCSNNSSSSINSSSNSKKRIRYYRERVQWNLADPETPNPAVFAAGIAQDFGLSYTQMLDLVESIQRQLTAFVQEQCTYAPAHVLRPQQQQEKPAALAPHLYYDVTGTGQKGGS